MIPGKSEKSVKIGNNLIGTLLAKATPRLGGPSWGVGGYLPEPLPERIPPSRGAHRALGPTPQRDCETPAILLARLPARLLARLESKPVANLLVLVSFTGKFANVLDSFTSKFTDILE